MSYLITSHIPKALPHLCHSQNKISSFSINSKQINHQKSNRPNKAVLDPSICTKVLEKFSNKISCVAFPITTLIGTIVEPAYGVTGENYELDWVSIAIESGVCAFLYFLVAPPIIMNWLRLRWFKRNVFEMYLQFMFVFLFFPGVLLWAPFLNFRKFPRDPEMKYPWSIPEDPNKIRNDYRKYPWATLDDYEVE